ncbi:hypothetical protein [Nocardia sp. NPDC052566]|uniref:hypothetical protein n=1 Tax=Nocardia sp. NPDC052566 TaxID=3364330 RepID=UPI0037CB45C4
MRLALSIALMLFLVTGCGADGDPAFHYQVREGANLNYLIRDGKTAAHLVLRSGKDPRIVVAFPAGNSGTGAWFEPLEAAAEWELDQAPKVQQDSDSRGRPRYGIEFIASIRTPRLTLRQAVLSNVRVLRDYNQLGTVPADVVVPPKFSGNTVTFDRDRLDGAPGYRLTLDVIGGTAGTDRHYRAAVDGRIRLRVTALTGDTPLTPLAGSELLNGAAAHNDGARNTLTYLSYREKFLGGSWQYDTYFGRDTLISMMMLMPVLAPDATEAGLRSVLTRLAPDGTVAHEESLSEFAILARKKQDGGLGDQPILDYTMIDENYLLAPVAAAYLLDNKPGSERAHDYLGDNETGKALVRNLRLVVSSAAAFAGDPRFGNLIALKPGRDSGQWRDSDIGIGGGRYPYDVNAILVPAALEATARLLDSGMLTPFLSADDRLELGFAAAHAKVWRAEVARLFSVTIDAPQAQRAVDAYSAQIGIPATEAGNPITFPAISLGADGGPIPIVHSDDVFDLLFGTPAPEILERKVATLIRPFPLGLMTGAGMVVANPVFAGPELQAKFTTHDYHGTVVWSWMQAAFASGLQRQLHRPDLPKSVRDNLIAAQDKLWNAIDAAKTMQNSELWSWHYENGTFRITPFGANTADVTESNAAQLWSSVYLAVQRPKS